MGTMMDLFTWRIGIILLGILSIVIGLYFIWALPPSRNFKARPLNFAILTKSLLQHVKDQDLSVYSVLPLY